MLPLDIQNLILDFVQKKCHTCHSKINLLDDQVISHNVKFVFCNKECYNFI